MGQLQAGSGMARSRAKARLNWVVPGPALGKMQGEAACRAGDASGQGETLDRCAGDADELQLSPASPLAGPVYTKPPRTGPIYPLAD